CEEIQYNVAVLRAHNFYEMAEQSGGLGVIERNAQRLKLCRTLPVLKPAQKVRWHLTFFLLILQPQFEIDVVPTLLSALIHEAGRLGLFEDYSAFVLSLRIGFVRPTPNLVLGGRTHLCTLDQLFWKVFARRDRPRPVRTPNPIPLVGANIEIRQVQTLLAIPLASTCTVSFYLVVITVDLLLPDRHAKWGSLSLVLPVHENVVDIGCEECTLRTTGLHQPRNTPDEV